MKNIKEERVKRKVTGVELGQVLGVTKQYVSMVENKKIKNVLVLKISQVSLGWQKL